MQRMLLLLAGALAALGAKVEMCNIPGDIKEDRTNFNTVLVEERNVEKRLANGDLLGNCNENCAEVCDDSNECTVDFELVTDCTCITEDVVCDDGNVCTADSCDVSSGCVNDPAPRSGASCNADSNVCTPYDSCQAGTCTAGADPLDCDDGFSCTDDSCDAVSGCVNTPVNSRCDDSASCSTDTCEPSNDNNNGDGCVFTENDAACDDGEVCTVDSCVSGSHLATGCVIDSTSMNGEACEADSNVCTADFCNAGTCQFSFGVECNDGFGCTEDYCNPVSGCYHIEDDFSCTGGPACGYDYCDEDSGCEVALYDNLCDDGIPCTLNECTYGGCQYTPSNLGCNDGVGCTDDFCMPEEQYADSDGCVFAIDGRRVAYTSQGDQNLPLNNNLPQITGPQWIRGKDEPNL